MEVEKERFGEFLAAIKEKEVQASLGCDGWIILNRTCKHSLTICAQSCAHFKTKPIPGGVSPATEIRCECWASGKPVKLCTIFLKKENTNEQGK